MKILTAILIVALTCVLRGNEEFAPKASSLLPSVVAISDVIASGVLKADMGETDKNGNTEMRFYLTNFNILKGRIAEHVDPFTGSAAPSSSLALNFRFRGLAEDRQDYRFFSGKRVIVFLKKKGAALENIDPWFYIQSENGMLVEEIRGLVKKEE